MTLRLLDTRRGEKLQFKPIDHGPVGLYVCGVTPYDTGHLGHAFTYLSFDVLHRYLEYLGHDVVYVQNLTDVDDDLLERARQAGEDYLALGNRHVTTFLTEMAALNWLPPDNFPRATQHIAQMQAMIGRLLERGNAYRAEGYVFFDLASWPSYGELSRLPRKAMLPIANERGNLPDLPGKRDPLDFVLWQPSAPDEPSWPSPWGAGRPGWHIECSAMSTAYLGSRFEIHGGGADLIFPHHESEIAQSEGATGERPFVEWWLHAGMLRYADEKMSKSLGNMVLVRDLLRSYSGDAIRHYLVSHHYRDEIMFDEADLEASAVAAARLRYACRVAEEIEPLAPALADPASLQPVVAEHRERFLAAMDDDLDTPAAMPELHALAAACLSDNDPQLKAEAGWMVRELGARVLGLRLATVPSLGESQRAEDAGAAVVAAP
ncbi:MAG TPA: cysteine--tRNA ligase [Candidatus Limnocylindrales bacterium]|nr:cysteine--tRNA ligase [Candidatus Limnocylindrales bacterium]